MSLVFWLYAIDVAGALDSFFATCAVISGIGFFFAAIFAFITLCEGDADSDNWRIWRRCVAFILTIFLPSVLLTILIPSPKTLYLMLGAKTAEDVVKNPKIQEAGGKVMELINKKLEALTKEDDAAKEKK